MAGKDKPHRPSIDIPPLTPESATSNLSQTSATPTAAHMAAPGFSILSSATALPSGADPLSAIGNAGSHKSAIPPDIEAVAILMRNLKEMNQRLKGMYESIETQTEKSATLGPVIKAGEKIATLKLRLEKQIADHDAALVTVRAELETRVKERLEGRLRQYVTDEVRTSVAKKIEKKVEQELKTQIPQSLRNQTTGHARQMAEIKMHLHNSEARRINATLTRKEKLRPLIPSHGTSPSPLFPTNIDTCLAMSGKDIQQLVKVYELDKGSPVSPGGISREENINKFLDHIGAPFHVLPAPTVTSPSPKATRLGGPILITKRAVV
ncbi:uncharacterized protein ARMOST_00495 [Armillaria ostoyae]|uniref:Uncharacterized protein n=1 Tax=Armillaria ostoyae TaxID=47428 RepID=A0A284QLA1_ARMOS|nr:uncharacterized protein ARMOST_00495 [Armillaria ostoyae]